MADVPSNTTRHVAGATGIMMASILASRLLGLVRDAVISHQLGQKYAADVYKGAFQIPDLLFFLIAGGALSSAFIPVFTSCIAEGREDDAWNLFSAVATIMFVVVGAFVVFGEVFTAPLMHLVNPGFPPAKVAATVPLTRIVLPAQVCFFIGGLLMGCQFARGKFLIPSLGPIVYNIGIIIGGLVLYRWLGLPGFCWGALGGAVAGNFFLQIWGAKRVGMRFRISFAGRRPDVVRVWKLMLPVVLGVALPQVSIWINRAFAGVLGDGPMAALDNANRIMQVPLGIFAQAMAVAVFPTLSALAATGRLAEMRDTSSGSLRSLLFLTIPSSVYLILMATPIVQLLLQHGKFHADDTALASVALGFYGIGIFAWSAQSILSRSFYALQDTVTPVLIGTGVTLVFVPMNWLFMNTLAMGIRGLALATTVAAILHAVVMLWVLRRRLGGFDGRRLALSVARVLAASAAGGVACWGARSGVDWVLGAAVGGTLHVKAVAAIELLAGAAAGGLVYVGACVLLRAQELREAVGLLRRRARPA